MKKRNGFCVDGLFSPGFIDRDEEVVLSICEVKMTRLQMAECLKMTNFQAARSLSGAMRVRFNPRRGETIKDLVRRARRTDFVGLVDCGPSATRLLLKIFEFKKINVKSWWDSTQKFATLYGKARKQRHVSSGKVVQMKPKTSAA